MLHSLILGVVLIGGVLDLSLVTSTRPMTTAIARVEHCCFFWRIDGLSSGRRAHRHEMTAGGSRVELIHLRNSKTIVRYAGPLLERCVLLSGLCGVHGRLRVLGGPLGRIPLLALLFTATTTLLFLRATDMSSHYRC